ncbi:hypothetical protein Taro_000847 [Colocasia esculenta]|uniref:CDC20/Fizzy WD40 domain-containing protein n=1 Tax=Colocasia esculenta TaxID=4460 RepID=A0A843THG7_COLES|nr:hypothetical protein [Colocasia esculenta]
MELPGNTPLPSFLPSSSLSQSSAASRTIYSDRFIPSRTGSNFALFDLSPSPPPASSSSSSSSSSSRRSPGGSGGREDGSGAYSALLRTVLFGPDAGGVAVPPATPDRGPLSAGRASASSSPAGASGGGAARSFSPASTSSSSPGPAVRRNIFRYKTEVRGGISLTPPGYDEGLLGAVAGPPKVSRKVPRSPYKVLDAPALQDDFYLNLVDWSSNNVLAVGLGNCVYLWNACSSKVTKLCDMGLDDSVCSVGWSQRGGHLAVGTNLGKVQIWDASRCQRIRSMEGHRLRVGSLAWSSTILSSGSRDKIILHRDIRTQEDYASKLTGHKSEVCGLKWSHDNRELASGGNDNRLFVWNQHSTKHVLKYSEHTAAVKAIAWSPHLHGLLASGGGTADRCIRFWNTTTNSYLSCMETGSQVSLIYWVELLNPLFLLLQKQLSSVVLATLTGHTYRVLYLAVSPDGQTIVTGAGDETLRFWNVFPSPKSRNTENDIGATSLGRTMIR